MYPPAIDHQQVLWDGTSTGGTASLNWAEEVESTELAANMAYMANPVWQTAPPTPTMAQIPIHMAAVPQINPYAAPYQQPPPIIPPPATILPNLESTNYYAPTNSFKNYNNRERRRNREREFRLSSHLLIPPENTRICH